MGKQDITKKPDGVIECEMIIGNNLCFIQVVPVEKTDLISIRKMIENESVEHTNFYLNKTDFFMFCRKISGKKEFRGMTIINPKKEDFRIVINADEDLETSTMTMEEDALEELIHRKKTLGESLKNKPHFVYIAM